jgi:diguanylate cyclase (GGDEF)-like protein
MGRLDHEAAGISQQELDALLAEREALGTRLAELEAAAAERERAQRVLVQEAIFAKLLQDVTAAANGARSRDEAFATCLRAVCAAMSWPVGHVWVRGGATESRLRSTDIWHLVDAARYGPLREATSSLACRPGRGIVGRVLATGAAVSSTEPGFEDPSRLRREVAGQLGLRASVGVPVRVGYEVTAVLELFACDASPADPRTLQVLEYIGTQLGRVCERAGAEQALRALAERMDDALRAARVGTWSWDMEADRVVWDAHVQALFGRQDGVFARSYREALERLSAEGRLSVGQAVQRAVQDAQPFEVEVPANWDDGTPRVLALRGRVHVERGRPVRMSGVCWDVTERKHAEQRIHELAFYDALTGLPNRRLFDARLEASLVEARRRGRRAAVIFLDLDRFKEINDTLGHRIGDEVLAQVAQRLVHSVRMRDTVLRSPPSEGDTDPAVSRFGGDEFTLLLGDVSGPAVPGRVAERILHCLRRPFPVGEREIYVTASIGIAVFPDDGENVDALLANADTAMYQAKSEGANDFRFFSPTLNAAAARRFAIGHRLRRALARRAFVLHYQPIVEARGRAVLGLEALLRLEDGAEAVSPQEFIPIAEETGLIVPIGEWVLRQACRQARRWQRAGFPQLGISVNLSSRQLHKPGLVEAVERALRTSGLAATSLTLEITESSLLHEGAATLGALARLGALGVTIALDDFGTGYSSLSQLRRFSFHWLKIDQSFVSEVLTRPGDAALTAGLIRLAQRVGLGVVAEGVEREEQAAFLARHGCNRLQGYLVSRPLPVPEVLPFLRKTRASAAGRGIPARAARAD